MSMSMLSRSSSSALSQSLPRLLLSSPSPRRRWMSTSSSRDPRNPMTSNPLFPGSSSSSSSSSSGDQPPPPSSAPSQRGGGYRVAFFGTDHFSAPTLSALHSELQTGLLSELHVLRPVDRPRGRGLQIREGPVTRLATQYQLPQHPVDTDFRMTDYEIPTAVRDFDLGVVVSFGYFIPPRVVENFRNGMLNVHPSLLPKYRGASPIQTALFNQDLKTGVSVCEIHPERLDAGAVLAREEHPLTDLSTYESLSEDLSRRGAALLVHTIRNLDVLRARPPIVPEMPPGMRYDAPRLPKTIAEMDWTELDSEAAKARFRGLYGFRKVHTFLQPTGERLILTALQLDFQASDLPDSLLSNPETDVFFQAGDVVLDQERDRLLVRCKRGWVHVQEILPEFSRRPQGPSVWAARREPAAVPPEDPRLQLLEGTRLRFVAQFGNASPESESYRHESRSAAAAKEQRQQQQQQQS